MYRPKHLDRRNVYDVGADCFGNGYVHFKNGCVWYLGNFVLDAPAHAIGAAPDLPEETLLSLALVGALPEISFDVNSNDNGLVVDCRKYRFEVADWWRERRSKGSTLH